MDSSPIFTRNFEFVSHRKYCVRSANLVRKKCLGASKSISSIRADAGGSGEHVGLTRNADAAVRSGGLGMLG